MSELSLCGGKSTTLSYIFTNIYKEKKCELKYKYTTF